MSLGNVKYVTTQQFARTIDKVQRYANIMQGLISTKFPFLAKMPDSLYIMMATMGLESSFNIFHPDDANHTKISKIASSLGRQYWNDPVIVPIRSANAFVEEGLSAKALMASMGMYQIRNTRSSADVLQNIDLKYRTIAEDYGIMVNPGQSCSAPFTNDDTGATRSMVMGCIIMEGKYKTVSRRYNGNQAVAEAIAAYLGQKGARDILGSSPEGRVQLINNSTTWTSQVLVAAGLSFNNRNKVLLSIAPPPTNVETKTATVATSNNTPVPRNGCAGQT